MKLRLFFIFAAMLLLAGCGKPADQPIASGDGLGREWSGAPDQVRISVNNRLTREAKVHVDAPGAHYEMTIGPSQQGHMIVPATDYKFSFFAEGKPLAGNQYGEIDDANGAKGILWDIP